MSTAQIQSSPKLAKISNSAMQFRELINSLRQQSLKAQRQENHFPLKKIEDQPEIEKQSESTTGGFDNKILIEHHQLLGEQENGLKIKPKMTVGGRDTLKKKRIQLDFNPEISQKGHLQLQSKANISQQWSYQQSKQINKHHQSPKKNVSTQCQNQQMKRQEYSFNAPRQPVKVGSIIRQVKQAKIIEQQQISEQHKIRNLQQNRVIEYWQKQKRITEKSDPSEIFQFFTNLCVACDIYIKSPAIKKYKNCVYFGFPIVEDKHEGFLLFYEGRIYYGQFESGLKNGLGVEINFNDQIKHKGQFKQGHKTGKFYVEKPTQKYIGFLENGLYQGQGRLTSMDCVYEGLFSKGQKNGYGEQYYPKTGVKISGHFVNGVLQKKKPSKSIPSLERRKKSIPVKEKSSQKLQMIKRQSLQKHNRRMNKIRNQKDNEYQMEFGNQQYSDPPRIQFNTQKLQMYKQPLKPLPKITQFQYSFETSRNIGSLHSENNDSFTHRRPRQIMNWQNQQKMGTNQFEQPLPNPRLSILQCRQ